VRPDRYIMQCEKCKNNEATVHLTEIIKNVKSELHLCEGCAREVGLNSKLSNFTLTVPDMLSFLDVEETRDMVDATHCKSCGTSFVDYKRTGKLGCPDCYGHLRTALEPILMNFHGAKRHVGKMPSNYIEIKARGKVFLDASVKVMEKVETVADLRKKLEQAVLDERFEEAALIRDALKQREESGPRD
jgi:protein arginine kinase activator